MRRVGPCRRPLPRSDPFPMREPSQRRGNAARHRGEPGRGTLALTGSDGSVELIDPGRCARAGRCRRAGPAARCRLQPRWATARRLRRARADHALERANARRGRRAARIAWTCQAVAFSPDGTKLTAAELGVGRARVGVWDLKRRTLAADWSSVTVASIAYSPNGRLIAAAATVNGTEIRDTRTNALVKRLPTDDASRSVASTRRQARPPSAGTTARWSCTRPRTGGRSAVRSRATRQGSPIPSSRRTAAR